MGNGPWWVNGVTKACVTTSQWHRRCRSMLSGQDGRQCYGQGRLPVSHREVVAVETALGAQQQGLPHELLCSDLACQQPKFDRLQKRNWTRICK